MEPCAIIDPRLPAECVISLKKSGFQTITAPFCNLVDAPISGHPDIQMFIHENNLFVHPDIAPTFLKKVERYLNIIQCPTRLTNIYPGDIPYNIACTGKFALHKRNSTDPVILKYFTDNEIDIFETKQGYSKCSTLIVDDASIITSDKSIDAAARFAGIDSLLISQGYIDLPGYNYGFIGGASGRYLNTIYLTGSLGSHPDREHIEIFIESKKMHLNILTKQKTYDSGSIFFIS